MKKPITRRLVQVLGVTLSITMNLSAQVFIPAQIERDWLNEQIPGIVNGIGIMDTLHPGIDQLLWAGFQQTPDQPGHLNLHGVQFLDSLRYFAIMDHGIPGQDTLSIEGLPAHLVNMNIQIGEGHLILPILPDHMGELFINYYMNDYNPGNYTVNIENMADTIDLLCLKGEPQVTWSGSCFISNIRLHLYGPMNISCPNGSSSFGAIELGIFEHANPYSIDLSNFGAEELHISSSDLDTPILWPIGVRTLSILSGQVDDMAITSFPNTITALGIHSSAPFCLPTIPDGVSDLEILDGPTCIPNWPEALQSYFHAPIYHEQGTAPLCSILNTDCPGNYPGITGSVFVDLDGDGVQDSDEFRPAGASVQLQPGNAVVPCDTEGFWQVGMPPGSYAIIPNANSPYIQAFTPSAHTADVPNMGDIDTDNHFAVTLIPNMQDLQTWVYADPARPGFDNRVFLNYRNFGTVPVDATLTLQWDADQQWVGSSVAPSSLSGNTATWELGTLAIGAEGLLTVDLGTLATVPLDTPIEHLLTIGPLPGDETPNDNVAVYNDVVVGSYDPNDKLLIPATMSPTQLQDPAARIEYTVRFQNTGTFPAERVVILDTLPEGLILESIQFLASSHPNNWYLTDGVLHVIHNNIVLPDSTSDEPDSHGFIRFSIKPEPTLANGSTIANIAHIIFDFNEAIITPPAVFTVDVLASVNEVQRSTWSLWPNPTRDVLRLTSTDGALANLPCVVRDITGRAVMATSTSASGDMHVGALSSGTYTLQLSGQAEVLRFVKE